MSIPMIESGANTESQISLIGRDIENLANELQEVENRLLNMLARIEVTVAGGAVENEKLHQQGGIFGKINNAISRSQSSVQALRSVINQIEVYV